MATKRKVGKGRQTRLVTISEKRFTELFSLFCDAHWRAHVRVTTGTYITDTFRHTSGLSRAVAAGIMTVLHNEGILREDY